MRSTLTVLLVLISLVSHGQSPSLSLFGFKPNVGGKKDVMYSFMLQDNINWRNLIYRIVAKLIAKVTNRADFKKSHLSVVLIADE